MECSKNNYLDVLGKISISVIGTNKEQVSMYMKLNLDLTFKNLEEAIKKYPKLRKKIRVNLRHINLNFSWKSVTQALVVAMISMDFRRFSNDFSSIFVRAVCDEGTKAESQKGVAWSSAHVLALALCSRFVLLENLSKWLSNFARSAFFRCVPTSPPSKK